MICKKNISTFNSVYSLSRTVKMLISFHTEVYYIKVRKTSDTHVINGVTYDKKVFANKV